MRSSGPTGEIRWSYLPAVVFGPWKAEIGPAGGTLTAQIVRVDAYRSAQTPLTLVLPTGRTSARWPVVTLQISGPSLLATIGPRSPA